MNRALDVQEITRVIPVDADNESDERGWWPVVAFTDGESRSPTVSS